MRTSAERLEMAALMEARASEAADETSRQAYFSMATDWREMANLVAAQEQQRVKGLLPES